MKKTKIIRLTCAMLSLLAVVGCSVKEEGNKVTVKEPGGSITIIDDKDKDKEVEEPSISVGKIDTYENLEISDWLSKDVVIVSKENENLEKMKLEELSDSYPKSLYLYNLTTKEYTLLKEEQNLNLGGATLSSDKKYLLYHGSSLGDLSYFVLDIESLENSDVLKGAIGSAKWVDEDKIIGAGYTGGAYYVSTKGEDISLKELEKENIFIITKIKDVIYYNTAYDSTLMAFNLSSKEVSSLNLPDVFGVYSAPDENQMLVLQYKGSKQILSLYDVDGSNGKIIAESLEIGGVSWSPDQRMIAYSMKEDGSSSNISGLYLYDMLTGNSTQIGVDIWNVATSWSPSGEELSCIQWDGKQYNSSIVYLNYSLQK